MKHFLKTVSRLFAYVMAMWFSQAAFAANNTITIGQAIDLSGPDSSIGRDYVAGIKTYLDMVNSLGGVNGKKIHYVVRDDQGQPGMASALVTEMIKRDHVDYLFGGIGDETTQAVLNTPAFKKSEHILYAPLAGASSNKDPRVLIWRPVYQQELQYIFSHFNKLGVKNIGIVYQESVTNKQALSSLVDESRKAGMKVTGTMPIGGAGSQLETEVALLAGGHPEFVVVIADTSNVALFLKEFRKHESQTFVASTSLIDLAALQKLVSAKTLEWTIFSQVVPNPTAANTAMQIEHLNMMKKFSDETLSSFSLEGFAAAKTLVKMIQQSKHNRSALQEYIAQQSDIDLGGISVSYSKTNNNLSKYLEIALFKKRGGLKY